MNRNRYIVILGLFFCLTATVKAIDFTETTDLPGGVNPFDPSVGTLDPGANMVSGSLSGNCLVGSYGLSCNPGTIAGGDTDDTFLLTVPIGYQITSLTVTTSAVSGPTNFSASMELDTLPYAVVQFTPFLSPLDGTTFNLLTNPVGPGVYALSVFGQQALAEGAFSLNWSVTVNLAPIVASPSSYGTFTRVDQFDFVAQEDKIKGGFGVPSTADGAGSTYGQNVARADFGPITLLTAGGPVTVNFGPSAGAWSDSNLGSGSGRGLAFVTYNGPPAGSFKVNAVLDGEFQHDWFGLPDGSLDAAAQILVVDTDGFNTAVSASGKTLAQFLMGSTPAMGMIPPATAFENLRTALGGAILGSALVSPPRTFGTLLTVPVTTSLVTVAPGKQFTLIFDVSAASMIGGTIGYSAGTGSVDFYHSLHPATNLFTDASGNPFSGITPVGSAPATLRQPATVSLTGDTSNGLVGAIETVTATVTDTGAAPLPATLVTFTITSGPDTGVTVGGLTDANGQATFAYAGHSVGTDTIQARIGVLTSNLLQKTWITALPPTGAACNGTFSGNFNGNLTIKTGQSCTFLGGRVSGNVQQTGGNLTLSHTEVGGNTVVSGASTVNVGLGVTIDGNLQIQGLSSSAPQNRVCASAIHGSVQVQNNAAAVMIGAASPAGCPGNTVNGNVSVLSNSAATTIVGNTIGGNLEDQNNTAPTQVFSNTASGNLNCQSNALITGGGNKAAGHKAGQCAAF